MKIEYGKTADEFVLTLNRTETHDLLSSLNALIRELKNRAEHPAIDTFQGKKVDSQEMIFRYEKIAITMQYYLINPRETS